MKSFSLIRKELIQQKVNIQISVVGVENGYDEVNIQISAKYKYECLSATNCTWSKECRGICSRDKTLFKPRLD